VQVLVLDSHPEKPILNVIIAQYAVEETQAFVSCVDVRRE
jgi:hypothetical protein